MPAVWSRTCLGVLHFRSSRGDQRRQTRVDVPAARQSATMIGCVRSGGSVCSWWGLVVICGLACDRVSAGRWSSRRVRPRGRPAGKLLTPSVLCRQSAGGAGSQVGRCSRYSRCRHRPRATANNFTGTQLYRPGQDAWCWSPWPRSRGRRRQCAHGQVAVGTAIGPDVQVRMFDGPPTRLYGWRRASTRIAMRQGVRSM